LATRPDREAAGSGPAGEAARARLLELLRELSFQRRRVVLTSGKESDFFIDCKQAVLTAEGHALTGALAWAALDRLRMRAAAVAGVELGGCPLASAVAMTSFAAGSPIDAIYVRKEAKAHGSKRLIEGGTRLPAGSPVALLEDVVTTGGSTMAAAARLREAGFSIAGVIALVDRLEGGREAIESEGVAFHALYTRADFMAE
jgi:orotate phosphoribosyltransferase